LISLFYGCGTIGDWRIEELSVQKIEGSSKVLYYFSAWGGLDSNPHGFVVLDSTEEFSVDVNKILPIDYLSDIPSSINIEGVSHECYNSCGENYHKSTPIFIPMKLDKSENDDITIINRIYQYRGFAERETGLQRYEFEKFKETNDSLFFYNLNDIISLNGTHLDTLKVKKGEVFLRQDENKQLIKITINSIKKNQNTDEIEYAITYDLTPKTKTMISEFSTHGIFREAKIPQ
jgi:hypothetical protein